VAGERDRPDVARRRAQWAKYQNKIEPERLVFIDETWTKTNMAPLRGWAPLGMRLKAKVLVGCRGESSISAWSICVDTSCARSAPAETDP